MAENVNYFRILIKSLENIFIISEQNLNSSSCMQLLLSGYTLFISHHSATPHIMPSSNALKNSKQDFMQCHLLLKCISNSFLWEYPPPQVILPCKFLPVLLLKLFLCVNLTLAENLGNSFSSFVFWKIITKAIFIIIFLCLCLLPH